MEDKNVNEPGTSADVDAPGISMLDVLEEEKLAEEDANAVLGGSDDKNCSYSQGYVPRQALYACRTCSSVPFQPAAICLACSYACHEKHDLIELYTKRNVKCDCGNSKFEHMTCKLHIEKSSVNADNSYNQNYEGKYCTCHRPYPDEEDEEEDDMIQCIVCEDWYHGRHLGKQPPECEKYDEMICDTCMQKCDFLYFYLNKEKTVDVESTTPKKSKPSCILDDIKRNSEKMESKGPAYWSEGWRSLLCTCDKCKAMYAKLEIQYITDESDTIQSYEDAGKARTSSSTQYEEGMRAMSSLGRVQQIEMLHGYNDMKSELSEYLKQFADTKKVVTKEDIREFFDQLNTRKRKQTSSVPQHTCK